jgi:hypothetical protein
VIINAALLGKGSFHEIRLISIASLELPQRRAREMEREFKIRNGWDDSVSFLCRHYHRRGCTRERVIAGSVWFPRPNRRRPQDLCWFGIRVVCFLPDDHVVIDSHAQPNMRRRCMSLFTLTRQYLPGIKVGGEEWKSPRTPEELAFEHRESVVGVGGGGVVQ